MLVAAFVSVIAVVGVAGQQDASISVDDSGTLYLEAASNKSVLVQGDLLVHDAAVATVPYLEAALATLQARIDVLTAQLDCSPCNSTSTVAEPSECASSPCLNGGVCSVNGGVVCTCPLSHYGPLCETASDQCLSSPCLNGGVCATVMTHRTTNTLSNIRGVSQHFFTFSNLPTPTSAITMEFVSSGDFDALSKFIRVAQPKPLFDVFTSSEASCQDRNEIRVVELSALKVGTSMTFNVTFSNDVDQTECGVAPGYLTMTLEYDIAPNLWSYSCSCPNVNFQGPQCEIYFGQCDSNPCQNNGTCVDTEFSVYECECPTGTTGATCESTVGLCMSSPCENGATCSDVEPGTYSCECPLGFMGVTCSQEDNACVSSPCQNDGTCVGNAGLPYSCICAAGYTGEQCTESFAFVSRWDTTKIGLTNGLGVQLPLVAGGTYNMTVNWGDGDTDYIQSESQDEKNHVYRQSGVYTITIVGTKVEGWRFASDSTTDRQKLIEVSQWGPLRLIDDSAGGYFKDCTSLVVTATDALDLSGLTHLQEAFYNCIEFNANVSLWNVSRIDSFFLTFFGCSKFQGIGVEHWDVSNATVLSGMFDQCLVFVGNVSGWQVSNVLYMNQFVRDCALFNVDLSQWDVRNLLKMYQAFKGATAFNGDVSTWQTDSLTDMSAAFADCPNFNRDLSQWHVGSVTTFGGTFFGASVFTSDLSNWDTSKAINMQSMFESAFAFTSDLSNWNVPLVINMVSMFKSATSFNADLSSWCVQLISSHPNGFDSLASMYTGARPNWGSSSTC